MKALGVASTRRAAIIASVVLIALTGVGVGIALEQSAQITRQEHTFGQRSRVVVALVGGLLQSATTPQLIRSHTLQYGGRIDRRAFEAMFKPTPGLNTNNGAWAVLYSGRSVPLVEHGAVPAAEALRVAARARANLFAFGAVVAGFVPSAIAFPAVDGTRVLVTGTRLSIFSTLFGDEIRLLPNAYRSAITALLDPAGNVVAGVGPGVVPGRPVAGTARALRARSISGVIGGRFYERQPILGGLTAFVSAKPTEVAAVLSGGGRTVPWLLYGLVAAVCVVLVASLFVTARAGARLAASERELQRSNADLELLASTAAHDMHSHVRRMVAFAELLLDRLDARLDDQDRDYFARIIRQGRSLDALMSQLVAYARVGGEAITYVALNGSVEQALALHVDEIDRLRAQIDVASLGHVRGAPTALMEVFSNLIGNSLKYHVPGEAPWIEIRADRSDGRVWIRVRDHGVGVEPDAREEAFEPFRRLSAEYEGFGMGLAMVRRLAEVMGGTVTAESPPHGPGVVFVIALPEGTH